MPPPPHTPCHVDPPAPSLNPLASCAEQETVEELARIWRERELIEEQSDPSLAEIPRFYFPKVSTSSHSSQELQQGISKLVRARLSDRMASMILENSQMDHLWRLLKQHLSPPHSPGRDCLNYDDFIQVADAFTRTTERDVSSFFSASHFLKFPHDEYGRISVIHFFHWVRRKNALMRSRVEISSYDGSGDGQLTEREVEQWATDFIPSMPALEKLSAEFFQFYKVCLEKHTHLGGRD